jgi:acyl carrier protein
MTEPDIYAGLQRVFNAVFKRSDITITPALSAKDVPGWDSFRYVSMIVAAEKHFRIKLTGDDIDELNNIGDLAQVIARRCADRLKSS